MHVLTQSFLSTDNIYFANDKKHKELNLFPRYLLDNNKFIYFRDKHTSYWFKLTLKYLKTTPSIFNYNIHLASRTLKILQNTETE